MSTGLLTRPKVLRTAHQFLAIAEKQEAESVAAQVRSQLETYREREFQILVVGEIKRGKSSFINALLGEPDLLPIDTQVATSTIYKVMYGDTKKFKIFFNPPSDSEDDAQPQRPPIETTDPAEVAEYGTDTQNPNNEKEVNRIEVYVPNPFLESGVVIVDTPGLQSVVSEHGNIVWDYAPAASAICFVLDSVNAPATENDIANLNKFLEIAKQNSGATPPLFFVQTKVDLVEEEQWQTYRDRNVEIIQGNLSEYFAQPGVELQYFLISSERKALADASPEADVPDSGFSPVLELIESTTQEQAERSARNLLEPIKDMTEEKLQPHVTNKRDLLRRAFETDEKGRRAELTEITSHLAKWQKEIYPEVHEHFTHQAGLLRIEVNAQLRERLTPAASNPFISSIITDLRENVRETSSEEIANRADAIQAACVEECNAAIVDILGSYQDGMNTLIKESGDKLLVSLGYEGAVTPIEGIASSENLNMAEYSRFDLFRQGIYGGMFPVMLLTMGSVLLAGFTTSAVAASGVLAGATAAGAATAGGGALAGGALGLIAANPIIGSILAVVVVGCAYATYRHAKKMSTLRTVTNLEALLVRVVERARNEATKQFELIAHAYQKEVSDYFKKATNDVVDSAQRNIATINEGSSLNAKTYEEKTNALKEQEKAIKDLLNSLEEMLGASAQAASAPSQ